MRSRRAADASAAMPREPYLSVVATTRNDDHGGDMLYRTQLFVDGVIDQCNRHAVDAELIIVEWNPPEDRPRLAEALRWPASGGRCAVRIIEVPPEMHSRFAHSDRLPLFQMIAKNVGIRRARGRFVLATNVDLLFSDDLMAEIARRRLAERTVYRVDRYDVPPTIDLDAPIDAKLRQCEESIIRVARRDGTLDLRDGRFYRIYDSLYYLPWWLAIVIRVFRDGVPELVRGAVGRGRRTASALRGAAVGFARRLRGLVHLRSAARVRKTRLMRRIPHLRRLRTRMAVLGVGIVLTDILRGFLPSRDDVAEIGRALRDAASDYLGYARRRVQGWLRLVEYERARVKLHTNASGDFELLSREGWFRTRGYAELKLYSFHIDSLHMFAAYHSGIAERWWPHKIFHLDHGGGFQPDAEGVKRLNERLAQASIPQISNEQLDEWILEMFRTRRPLVFNEENWGLADVALAETLVLGHAVPAGERVRSGVAA